MLKEKKVIFFCPQMAVKLQGTQHQEKVGENIFFLKVREESGIFTVGNSEAYLARRLWACGLKGGAILF